MRVFSFMRRKLERAVIDYGIGSPECDIKHDLGGYGISVFSGRCSIDALSNIYLNRLMCH